MKRCPYCYEKIQNEAVLCRYCGSTLPATTSQEKPTTSKQPSGRKKKFLIALCVIVTILILCILTIIMTIRFFSSQESDITADGETREITPEAKYDPRQARIIKKTSGSLAEISISVLDRLDVINYCGISNSMTFSPSGDYGISTSNFGFLIQDLLDPSKSTFVLTSIKKGNMQISPDGNLIGFYNSQSIFFWNKQGEFVNELHLKELAQTYKISPDNLSLAVMYSADEIEVIDIKSGTQRKKIIIPQTKEIDFLSFSPDGKTMLFGYDNYFLYNEEGYLSPHYSGNSHLFVWSLSSDQLLGDFEIARTVFDINFSQDSSVIHFLSYLDDSLFYQNYSIEKEILSEEQSFISDMYSNSHLYIPSTNSIYVESTNYDTNITQILSTNIDTNEQRIIFSKGITEDRLLSFSMTSDARYFSVTGIPNFHYVYDLQDQKEIQFKLSNDLDYRYYMPVENVFSLDDQTLQTFDARFVFSLPECGSTNEQIFWSNKSENRATTSIDGRYSVKYHDYPDEKRHVVWDNSNNSLISVLDEVEPQEDGYAFSPDRTLVSKARPNLSVFRVEDGSLLHIYETNETKANGEKVYIHKAIFSNDNQFLVTLGDDNKMRIWDVFSGEPRAVIENIYSEYDREVAFSADGTNLYYLKDDKLSIYTVPDGELVKQMSLSSSLGYSVFSVSPDGSIVAINSEKGVDFYDLSTGAFIRSLKLDLPTSDVDEFINKIGFSHDGTMLAVYSGDSILIYGVK